MSLLLAVLLAILVYLWFRSKRGTPDVVRDSTPALDAWIKSALEHELAEVVLGVRGSTPEERRKLAQTLANEPDADVVSRIEAKVKSVEIEFVRYPHDPDVEATLRVRYEDGGTGTAKRRLEPAEVPVAVRQDFDAKKVTRVFRTWTFPWQGMQAL